jgi:hypothetical protein
MPHKKRSAKKTMRRKRGGYYGANGAIAPGAMEWKSGQETAAPPHVKGGSKRRKSKKSKKTMKKKGGAAYGSVSASFQGTGSRGIADHVPVDIKGSAADSAAFGAFNNKA